MIEAQPDGDYVAVIGLARSGEAVATLLRGTGHEVFASDAGDSAELRRAAERLRGLGVHVELGQHDVARIRRARCVIVSPGVPPQAPPVRSAREAGVAVRSEVAVALDHLRDSNIVAVTGTNGKSTTTALIAHLLCATGRNAVAAGNIGRALSEVALQPRRPEWIALELSSFQLHDTPEFAPRAGVLTNLSPDHLDRYATVEEYYADKQRIFAGATKDSVWVTNADDAAVQRLSAGVPGAHYRFSLSGAADAWYDAASSQLHLFDQPLCARGELQLIGAHNVANALAAALAVAVATGRPRDVQTHSLLRKGLRSFRGLPHRLEIVGELNGVLWVNDSKATNVDSARVALAALDRPTVLLLGGRHKGESYSGLLAGARAPIRRLIAFGEAAPLIARELETAELPLDVLGSDFGEVVARARAVARPGDAVLLAPACSSYDMFRDYEERGNRFKALVLGMDS